ncbi:insulinase family protein [Aquirhabdus sp.]|uniref:insulinase family protein n=1 Tax=Aquirhabdus sp. TaxID=2824160 RepID=UPI00396CAE2F
MTAALPTEPSKTSVNTFETFELLRREPVEALSAELFEFRHKVTGAVHYHLAADNDENVFMVAFRTQPMDSTGIAHVLEHTALCGSKRYPVRDPFFSMIKRSLNTFMNAFTSADWTAYPFASQNKTDFFNLLSVYLDAAFFANLDPLDFAQEGIRIELEAGKPVYKGIVFNEMKGAMSSPTDQLYHQLAHTLYPTTTYHYNSGGDPADIPKLTHQTLVDFYRSHYHPSNAVFMTYGNLSPAVLQQRFEEQALSQFQMGERRVSVPEVRYIEPQRVEATYAVDISEGETLENRTHLVLAWLLPKTTDIQARFALRLVEGVLLEDSASPLRHYVETCGLGESPSPLLGLDDSNFEMSFFCGLQGSNAEQADAFEAGVLAVLERIAAGEVNVEQVEAVLHQIELQQREIGGGSYPYGLQLLLNGLGSAIHGGDPLAVWQLEPLLAELRENLKDAHYLPNLVRQYLLENPHRVRLILSPDSEKTAHDQQLEQEKLDQIEAHLTAEDRIKLERDALALAERQATIDDLSILPKVGLEDIPVDLNIQIGETKTLHVANTSAPIHCYAAGTNGLYYQQVLIEVPQSLLNGKLLSLYVSLVGSVGAGELDYLEIQQRQTAVSGGINLGASLRTSVNDQGLISSYLVLSTKSLAHKVEAISLLHDAFIKLRLDEEDRILELLQQRKSRWQSRISGSGHAYAMQTSARDLSALTHYEYENTGLPALQWLRDLLTQIEQDDAVKTQLLSDLSVLHQQIIGLPRQFLLVAEENKLADLTSEIEHVWKNTAFASTTEAVTTTSHQEKVVDVAWLIQTNVQFCAAAYPAPVVDHPDTAPLMVLGPYLRNGFLHRALREQGGAYGGGAGYDGNACAFRFHSYRDPRLAETFVDFEASIQWLFDTPQEAYQLEEAILGLMGAMDKPSSPAGEAVSSCHSLLHGRTPEQRRALRKALLAVTLSDLQRVAQIYLKPELRRRSVVAPYAKEAELITLGFTIDRV